MFEIGQGGFIMVFRLFVVMTEENEMFRSIGMQTERQRSADRLVDTVANESYGVVGEHFSEETRCPTVSEVGFSKVFIIKHHIFAGSKYGTMKMN